MTRLLRGVARSIAEAFILPEPIVEIGSYQVEKQDGLVDLRSLFCGKAYTGVDFREGPGVDVVASVEKLPQASASVGTVLAFSTFEHVQRFWVGFDEVHRILRPDGVFIVACPFYFHQHGYPSDYWRFTPEALELLLERYPNRVLGWHGADRRPANVWAAAFRERAAVPTVEQFANYQRLLKIHAREPLSMRRRLTFGLGRLICGRRPFAPHLDRELCSTQLRRAA
jgi:SAM-dependent methyltransferase